MLNCSACQQWHGSSTNAPSQVQRSHCEVVKLQEYHECRIVFETCSSNDFLDESGLNQL